MRTTKKNNKIISFLTALVIMLNILPMCIVQADDTVAISTVNDLKEFFEKCVYDEYSKNKKFVLQNDIDLNGVEIKRSSIAYKYSCGYSKLDGIENLVSDQMLGF